MLLQYVHYTQRLKIVFEAAIFPHAIVQCILARMAKWRMTQVMGEGNSFDQIFIQT